MRRRIGELGQRRICERENWRKGDREMVRWRDGERRGDDGFYENQRSYRS